MEINFEKKCTELEAKIKVLEFENEFLIEQAGENNLLSKVFKDIIEYKDTHSLFNKITESIAILLDIPYVGIFEFNDKSFNNLNSYAVFDESDSVPQIEINKIITKTILTGKKYHTDLTDGNCMFNYPDNNFIPNELLIIPMFSKSVSNRFFVLASQQKKTFLSKKIPVLEKLVNIISVNLDKFYYRKELEELNIELEKRVEIRTKELITANKKLTDEIEERKKIESELRTLSTAVEQSPTTIVITDTKGKIEYVNPQFTNLTGYTFKDALGKNPRVLKSGKTPKETYKDLWDTITSGKIWRGEFINRKKNGEEFWESAVIAPIKNEKDEITSFIAIKEDITINKLAEATLQKKNKELLATEEELRAANEELYTINDALRENMHELEKAKEKITLSEDKFKTAFKTSPDSININRLKDGMYIEINEGFTRITGYTWDDVKNKTSYDIDIWTDKKDRDTLVKDLLEKGYCSNLEAKFKMKNGKIVTGLMSAKIINLSGEKYILSVTRDIQKTKDIETALIKAKEKAEMADKLKSAFLANMSHEIRTPMNGIIGFIQLLKNKNLDHKKRDYFMNIIEKSGTQLLSIINDIVDISKIEAGQIKIHSVDIDINNVLSDLYETFKQSAVEKGLKLTLNIDAANIYNHLKSDEVRLKQILSNLINNALKFTHKGNIEFGYRLVEQHGHLPQQVEFYVKDTGIGIKPDDLKIIFERFRQVELTATRQYGGTGLGLAITKALTEKLGGEIRVSSKPGNGSTFYVTLPYIPAKEVKTHTEFVNNTFKSLKNWSNKTILIAEDETSNFIYLEELLRESKVNIIRAVNGKEACEICNSDNIDLILMDIKMPEMDGLEAARIIKSLNPKIPIIAQTAYALEGDKEKTMKAGCVDYITKPILFNTLISKIEKYINN